MIHEYEFTDTGSVWHGHVEYNSATDGFPVPRRVVCTRSARGQPRPTDIDTYEFKDLHFGDVPDSEFQLSAFGISGARESP